MNTIITIDQLANQLTNKLTGSGLRLFDCRFSLADENAGQEAYHNAHIPGAHYINMNKLLSAPHIAGKTGRHPLPEKADWIKTVKALGIAPTQQVVMYDDNGGATAARMWWMLRWIGHDRGAVLDGGWQAWQQASLPVSADVPAPPQIGKAEFPILPALVQTITAEELDGHQQLILDARELPRFRGETEPLDPVAGHIPGALCSPFSENLNDQGYFLEAAELRAKFRAAVNAAKPVVCYCGSGVTAAHNILAMKIAGFDEAILYPGSWSDWITDPGRPVATGDQD